MSDMNEHPWDRVMDYPVEGCECSNCNYARYFEDLSDEEQEREIELMLQYAGGDE
jgi:hypothetical protein